MIERCDRVGMMTLGESDHRSVHDPEWKVEVLLGEVSDPLPLRVQDRFDHELSIGDRAGERQLSMDADPVGKQISDLGHDECRNEERPLGAGEQLDASTMVTVSLCCRSVKRSRVNDEHYAGR